MYAEDLWPAHLIDSQLWAMPSWQLDAQIELWERQRADVEAHPAAWCGGLMAAFLLHAQIDERLKIVRQEIDRREALASHSGGQRAKGRFTAEFLEDLKRRIPLEQYIVQNHSDTHLKFSGGGFVGHCPFHDDSSPSLHVWTTPDPHWFCFGCAQGGDIFSWLETEDASRSFVDCVEIAASLAQVAIPDLRFQSVSVMRAQ